MENQIIDPDPEVRKINALNELEAKSIADKKELMERFTVDDLRNPVTAQSITERMEAIDANYSAHYDWFFNPLKQ